MPCDQEDESLSKTLEYAYDDWCIAQMAKALGKTDDYDYFMKRAASYKNIYDPSHRLDAVEGFARQLAHAVRSRMLLAAATNLDDVTEGDQFAIFLVCAAGCAGPDRVDGRQGEIRRETGFAV